MTRKVFPNRMVAHVWAQRSQQEGRSHNGNLWFDGDTIYSYGRHFPIARFVPGKRGAWGVLATTARRSVTTSAHCRTVRSAIPDTYPVFRVPHVDVDWGHSYNLADYKARVTEALALAARSRAEHRISRYYALAREVVEEGNRYAAFFGFRQRIKVPADLDAHAHTALKRAQARAAKRKAIWREEFGVDLPLWRGMLTNTLRHAAAFPPVLRVANGETIQTSHGATFPIAHAVHAWPIIKRCRERGEGWERKEHSIHLGHFQIDAIGADGSVTAGCHRVAWEEVRHVAEQLGLILGGTP